MEEVKANPTAEWSAAEKAWLEKEVPLELQGVAMRHGKLMYQHAIAVGATNHALGVLLSQTRGNRACAHALNVMTLALNGMAQEVLKGWGKSLKEFQEVQLDIERLAAMASAGKPEAQAGQSVSPGGIILNG